ncbi:MAG: tandem-95 repeat protein, partial [Pseudomonadales bacterium]
TDVDNANTTVTLTLSDTAAGALSTATSGAVTSTYNAGTGVWNASGAVADVNALLAGVSFTPTLNYNSDFNITTAVDDGVAPAVTGLKIVTGTAVNDAPTATNLTTDEVYSEDIPLDLLDIVVADVDNANVIVTLTLSNPLAGTLNTGTAGAVSSSYNVATGVWQASGLTSDVNTLLADLLFTPTANLSVDFSLSSTVSDAVAPDISGTKNLFGTAVNDAPAATNLDAPETFVEDMPLELADIIVADIDSTNVTVSLSLSNIAAGQLTTSTAGASTSTFNPATGLWTATGLIADVNALLVDVSFIPSANFSEDFSLITSVDDGVSPAVVGSKLMRNVAVNDPPTVVNLSAAESYTEDASHALTPIIITDVDSPNITVTLTLSDPSAGVLSVDIVNTVTSTYDRQAGVWRASGAIGDVNTLLEGIVFTPSLNINHELSIDVTVSDGIAMPVSGTKLLTGVPVNDAPVGQGEAFELIEDGSIEIDLSTLLANDSDVDGDELTVVLVDLPRFGQLTTTESGTLVYRPSTAFSGQDFFTYRVSDGEFESELLTVILTVQNDVAAAVIDGQKRRLKSRRKKLTRQSKALCRYWKTPC